MDFISTRTSQFDYFSQVLGNPAWRHRKVLDFGGNRGGFLSEAGHSVDHEDYWCLDIGRAALAEGRKQFPKAHFLHYDRYNSEYNPGGCRNQPVPDSGLQFDFILAFSVFTHIHQREMLELIAQLRGLLAPSGVLAFTFTDPGYYTGLSSLPRGFYLRKLLKMLQLQFPSLDIDAVFQRARDCDWSILIDDTLHVEPDDGLCQQERQGRPLESYCAFYSVDYMAALFPEGDIQPPVGQEWQHCCILNRSSRIVEGA